MRCLRRGAALKYPGRPVNVEIFYLGTGERVPVPAKNDDKLLAEYTDAIAGIESGDFHADPEARRCPELPLLLYVRRLTPTATSVFFVVASLSL